jgi:hypothetical protein
VGPLAAALQRAAMANKMLSAKIRELQNTRPKDTLKTSFIAEQIHGKWRDWFNRYKDVFSRIAVNP